MTLQGYHWRKLTPEQELAIQQTYRKGRVSRAALASMWGVSRRTIDRTLLRAARDIVTVEIAPWRAQFEITDEGPVQVGPWVPS